jgi:hypothetical protein
MKKRLSHKGHKGHKENRLLQQSVLCDLCDLCGKSFFFDEPLPRGKPLRGFRLDIVRPLIEDL